jgi:hypothetical protein
MATVRPLQAETHITYRMSVDSFRREMERREVFHDVVARYAQALVGLIMQSTACNAIHCRTDPPSARTARVTRFIVFG